ncbi:MAG: transposase, partial [Chloroflexi bacterium]|nr:transposase [Chloroflexota bacterium]
GPCRKTWSEPIPGVAPFMRYSRAVIRKTLDMYVFGGSSLRIVAQMLRSEINGTERARHWDPEGLEWPELPEHRKIRLSHTSVWRWLQEAGRRANKDENRFGEIWQSGIWVADSTLGKVKGVWIGVLGVADAVSRVVFETVRIAAESEDEVLRKFARLRGFGVNAKGIKGLVSDGAEAYRLVLEGVMKRVVHQRCVFHLWRNIGTHLRSLKETKGEETALAFKRAVRGVWDAASYEDARLGLAALLREWAGEPCVVPALRLIEASFEEATTHLKGMVEGMPRTSNVVEWLWQGYKKRLRIMGQFMSVGGMDSFNGVWALHVNFQRYQKRKERKRPVRNPGHCPLEMAGGQVAQLSWMDVLAI